MKVPLAWIREYVDLPADPQKVAEMLAQIGFPVDAVKERPVVTGVVVGRIEELEKHPNADRLQVGKINVGNGALLTIATAATNVARGQTIAVATIGAQLPHLKIERRKMRGVESEGMMISADELALPPEWFEDGIMQFETDLQPGTDVVEYFRLSEAVLDVDVTSNRVDAMSMIGLARELAAYQGVALRAPEPRTIPSTLQSNADVRIESPNCKLFALQEFDGVRVGPSPAWMRIRLALAGQRPINNLVDISNYVMLEVGQPTHFYDAAKIPDKQLVVRDARGGEQLVTLDGEKHELTAEDLVIASARGPEGFAGLMGGATSEVTDETTGILMEAATFTGSRVRRMSGRHGFRSEASSRHEKSLPTALALAGAKRAAELLAAQGASAGPLVVAGAQDEPNVVEFPLRDVKRLLGFALPVEQVRELLDRLGFAADAKDEHTLIVTAPPWRRDVAIAADVVEEVARMAGYDRIEPSIPKLAEHDVRSSDFELQQRIANELAALGYHEVVTYSLHGAQQYERLARAAVIPTFPPVEVLNPLSEDQRYLRTGLTLAHLQHLARIDAPARIFEIGHIFYQENGEPLEMAIVDFVFSAQALDEPSWQDTHFLRLKGDSEELLHALTGRRDFEFAADKRNGLHPGKTASILLDGREIAFIGQIDPRVCNAFDVRLNVYGGGIYLQRLPEYRAPLYRPPSRYPSTYRDLALVCDLDVTAARVEQVIAKTVGPLCTGARAFDEYRGEQVAPEKKSLAVRVTLQKFDTTITDEEADAAIAPALEALSKELGASLRE
ncbi:MAG TPA: phenylalanine--tRNA ligase subunit beta [Candidatus Baltobacteraceae bacterium]|nr:phenylalanine--tRNA ligase subunit beta [Candidatus Baltobacteraceae bacterium]